MGVVSQFSGLNTFVMLFGTVGFPLGLTKLISQLEKHNKWNEILPLLKTTFLITTSIGLVLFIASFVFSKDISEWLLNTNEYSQLVTLFGLSLPLSLGFSIFEALIRGIKKFNSYVILTVVSTVFGLALAIILVYAMGLRGVIVVMILQPVLNISLYSIYLKKNNIISFVDLIKSKMAITDNVKHVFKIGLSSLLVGTIAQFSLLIIRSTIIRIFGVEGNGIYQCIYGISNNYLNLFFMTVGAYTLPVLSENNSPEFVNKEVNNYVKLMLIVLIPFISLVFSFRMPLISLFYSNNFQPASNLFFFNLLGDYLKVFAWIFGLWLIPCSKIKAWLIFEISLSLNMLWIFYFIISFTNLGLNSVTVAYFISNLVFAIANYIYITKANNYKIEKKNKNDFIVSSVILVVIFAISEKFVNWGYFSTILLLMIWSYFVIKFSDAKNLYSSVKSSLTKKQ